MSVAETQTILLVDDEVNNRSAIRRALHRADLHVLEADNGRHALAVLEAAQAVDLILLDINMPVMDGYAFLDAFRADATNRAVPVCVMTAWADADNRRKAVDLGADDFVGKPVDNVELETRVKSLLRIRDYQKRLHMLNAGLESQVVARTQDLRTALQQLDDARQETERAYREAVLRLAMAAEFKDRVTAAHIQRMSHYAALLARRAGWPEAEADLLLEAAKMHDIGKIGVPDAILNKAGRLTVEEMEVMRTHAELGARLLAGSGSRLLQMAETVALTHHERYDGGGYPRGLAAEAIPEIGRIVAIADVFDALLTRRAYKEAWPFERVYAEMRAGAGTHFDAQLLELFMAEPAALLEIYRRYPDDAQPDLRHCYVAPTDAA